MSIDFHRLVRPIDINRLIFIDYYRLNRLISDDRLSSIGHAGRATRLWYGSDSNVSLLPYQTQFINYTLMYFDGGSCGATFV